MSCWANSSGAAAVVLRARVAVLVGAALCAVAVSVAAEASVSVVDSSVVVSSVVGVSSDTGPSSCVSDTTGPPLIPDVTAEGARRGELAELVPDHGLGHEHGHVLAPVVDGDGVAHHLGEDRRRARPGPHQLLGVGLVHLLDAPQQALLDERALLA